MKFMKSFMTRSLIVLSLLLCNVHSNAQKVSFDDVMSVRLQNMGPILENNQVKGYYSFYKVDKVDRKTNAYLLQIVDENLRPVAKKRMTHPKTTSLTEAVYNGKAFLFSFVDTKSKELKLVTYDKEMKRLGSRTYELDKWGMSQYYSGQSEVSNNKLIFAFGDKGFARYNLVKNKKVGYEIEYLSNDLKKANSWNHKSPKASKVMHMAGYGDAKGKYLVSAVTTKPKLLSNKDVTFGIQLLDLENKSLVFEKPLSSGKHLYSFMNAFINDDLQGITVFGEYFNADDNIIKDKSKGLCALQFDMDGKIIKKEHHSWNGVIKKKIGVDKKGRIEDGGYVALHRIAQSSDGHFYAIGEMYKKAASGLGIASQVLAGNNSEASMAKMVILDLILFDFNPDLTLNDVDVFEKKKTDFGLPRGMGHYPPSMLAHVIRAYGGFDYAFTQLNEDKSSFFSTYTSTEKEKKKKRKAYFGIISRTEGDDDYVVDKVDLSTEATSIRVFPAKAGYILLTEYFKKEKKLESRLEKINY